MSDTPSEDSASEHTDPVCNMQVDPQTAAAHLEHDGVTYYFCSTGCRDTFEASPDKYTA